MGRHIVVLGNCQTGGLRAGLGAMLPDDRVDGAMWLGQEPDELAGLLETTDVLVTSVARDEAQTVLDRYRSTAELLVVPAIYFTGLHPDLSQFLLVGGGELNGIAGPYHSKIVVWGWTHGLTRDEVLEAFTADTFAQLGYFDGWATAVEHLRGIFEPTDVDFASWYLSVVRRGAFMLTNNHPRLDAILELARSIAGRLGADADRVAYDWTQVVPDGLLASGVSWPVYPGVGDTLDLPGTFAWRMVDGEIIGLERFVDASLATYAALDPSTVDLRHLDADPRFLAVLGDRRPAADRPPADRPAAARAAATGGR